MPLADVSLMATGQATATLIAASIAAFAGVAATVVGAVNAAKARRRTDREQWWSRFIWAIERATSQTVGESELGLALLIQIIRTSWASAEDNQTALAVADLISQRNPAQKPRKVRNGRYG